MAACVACLQRVAHESVEPPAGRGQRLLDMREDLSVARNHDKRGQRFDQIERVRHFVEGVLAFELLKNHAKSVFPKESAEIRVRDAARTG